MAEYQKPAPWATVFADAQDVASANPSHLPAPAGPCISLRLQLLNIAGRKRNARPRGGGSVAKFTSARTRDIGRGEKELRVMRKGWVFEGRKSD